MEQNIFSLNGYYENLKTKRLGRPCIYLDRVDSTIDVANKEPPNTIVLAKEQLKGRGQRTNVWRSPLGCAMGSFRILFERGYYLSRKVCFLQHLISLAAARTLESIDRERLGKSVIKLKWPNDIIYRPKNSETALKIGGVLVTSQNIGQDYDITMSFGINIFNREPTTCVAEILGENVDVKLSIDSVVAKMMNYMEEKLMELNDDQFTYLKDDYMSRCLHTNKIVVDEEHGKVKVLQLDDDGYMTGERLRDKKPCRITKLTRFDW